MSSWKTEPTAGLEEAAERGPCGGPHALVPGDELSMRAVAGRLERVSRGADAMTGLLRRVDAGEWVGESGTAFRAVMGEMPGPYAVAARAFGDVARALYELADCVARSRDTARRAVERWCEAQEASRRFEFEEQVWRDVRPDLAAFAAQTGRWVRECSDPGESGRAEARRMVDEAQQEVEEADERALRTIRAASSDAPRDRGWGSAARGLRDSVLSPVTGAYLLTFSPDAGANWDGLREQATHPWEVPGETWSAFVDDPDYFLGAALPALLGGAAMKALNTRVPDLPEGPRLPKTAPWGPPGPRAAGPEIASTAPVIGRVHRSPEWIAEQSAKIAAHSWPNHGVRRKQFPWVDGQQGLADYVAGVIKTPSESFEALPGRTVYWDETHKVIVVQQDDHTGSVFPARKAYYDKEVRNAKESLILRRLQEGPS
jgi:hypothetical protein